MSTVAALLDGTVVASAAVALVLAPRVLRREAPARRPGRVFGRVFGPEPVLAAVVALVFLNQVLVAVYVDRVHGGDVSFITRHLPPGWFDVPRLGPLAARFPAPELLAPSVLRVQAFLELPLVLLAFTAVVRRLDRALYVRLARSPLIPLAAVAYTVAFGAVEWHLRNPYTVDDLVLRGLAACLTPPLIARLARSEPGTGGEPGADGQPGADGEPARSLFRFALDLWAYGQLMLVLYDTVLLYNLARIGDRLPSAAAALAVLVATRAVPARAPRPPGPHTAALAGTIGRALALFLVPALAIRYAQTFGTPELAALAGLLVVGAAVRRDASPLLLPALAGAAAGWAVATLAPGPYYEATLLRSATGALLATTALCALLDTTRTRLVVHS
ncbi:hypothetical protein [Streptomyces sp. CBMA156]|uniref:hypothetical protein n=1 Tax=Streptomyces sp. CBMA156 TaxID=1930280 RepID=UPI001661BB4F|nr:hypothetical protein [Streptomyces sp. CBMA156]MBD0673385.1 hypothetical protein [Streptomyces sp. CBMA156]